MQSLNKEQLYKKWAVVVIPTDTCYGFSCCYHDKKWISNIMTLKKRDNDKPFSILFASIDQVGKYCYLNKEQISFIKNNPYRSSFVLKKKEVLKDYFPGIDSVCIRIENEKYIKKYVDLFWSPIVTTSVNISWNNIVNNPNEIRRTFWSYDFVYFEFFNEFKAEGESKIWDLTADEFVCLR